jgi:hypothetical protein
VAGGPAVGGGEDVQPGNPRGPEDGVPNEGGDELGREVVKKSGEPPGAFFVELGAQQRRGAGSDEQVAIGGGALRTRSVGDDFDDGDDEAIQGERGVDPRGGAKSPHDGDPRTGVGEEPRGAGKHDGANGAGEDDAGREKLETPGADDRSLAGGEEGPVEDKGGHRGEVIRAENQTRMSDCEAQTPLEIAREILRSRGRPTSEAIQRGREQAARAREIKAEQMRAIFEGAPGARENQAPPAAGADALANEDDLEVIANLMASRKDPMAEARKGGTTASMLAQMDPATKRRYRDAFAEEVRALVARLPEDKGTTFVTELGTELEEGYKKAFEGLRGAPG